MRTQSPDTHPDVERILVEAYRRMMPAGRYRKVGEMNRAVELLALADVRRRYPNADDRECQLRVASRRIPADLMRKAFGWTSDVEGY
jgi:hypothetical protein